MANCNRIHTTLSYGDLVVQKYFGIVAMYSALLLMPGLLAAEVVGDAKAGKGKSVTCVACHGADGNSVNPQWPKIAGLGERYFVSQLKAFKEGPGGLRQTANAAMMYGMVAALSEQDMADLAAYYQSQTRTIGVTNDKFLAKGEAIYRGGNPDFGSAACIGCHGPQGNGNVLAGFPAVSGQHAEYTYNQLQAFHDEKRHGDPNGMMRNMVRKMSNEEMKAVAEYMQGLH